MLKINISAKARIELTKIGEYTYVNWGKRQAKKYVDDLLSFFDFLAQNPYVGIARDEIGKDIRSFPHHSHTIYYRVRGEELQIIGILHKSMDNLGYFSNDNED